MSLEQSYSKPISSGFNEVLGCTTHIGNDYSQKWCAICGNHYYGWHTCTRGYLVDFIPELGRKLSQSPCGARQKDGPTTCTLAQGHEGEHSAPVKWDSWR